MARLQALMTAPGPRGHPILGSVAELRDRPLETFLRARERYGDVVRFRLGGPYHAYLVAHPDGVKHVLQDNHRNYRKVPWYNGKLKAVVGNGLLTSEGEFWLRQRRLAQPAFHRQRIAALGGIMTEATEAMLARWATYPAGEPFDVAAEMMRLTLTIVSRALLGVDVEAEAAAVGEAVTVALEHTNRRMESYLDLAGWLPLPSRRRFEAAMARLDRIVYRIVEARRASAADSGDLLSMLLSVRDEATGEGMSDAQLRDEVMTIFLAGHETTAVAMSWTWYLLSQHAEVAERLRAELRRVLGGRAPAVEDLPSLPCTRMVIEESMRLYPPAWALSRSPLADDAIGGYRIPARSFVFPIPYVTHRHPALWPDPERFDPERFAPERSAERPRYAYFPFGGGPRQCIGAGFALIEAQLILATVAQRYHLDLVPGHPVEPEPLITLRPRHGMRVTLRPVDADLAARRVS